MGADFTFAIMKIFFKAPVTTVNLLLWYIQKYFKCESKYLYNCKGKVFFRKIVMFDDKFLK